MKMAISRRRFSALSSTALIVVLLAPVGAQPRQAFLYTAGGSTPTGQSFELLFAESLKTTYTLKGPVPIRTVPLHTELHVALQQHKKGELIFLTADRRTVVDLVRADEARKVLSDFGLEVVNPRLGAAPFYLFARTGEQLRGQTNPPLRVVYVDRIDGLKPPDVAGILDLILDARTTVTGPLASPRELARRLADDAADVVAIFDEDPSPFRSDFVLEYEQLNSLGTIQLVVFPPSKDDPGRLRTAQGDLMYAVMPYGEMAFNDARELVPPNATARMLALSTVPQGAAPGRDAGPLVLSNVRTIVGEQEFQRVWRLVSHAHLAALARTEAANSRCGDAPRPVYAPYLLNAHLTDRDNVVKGLALWSDLTLSLGSTAPANRSQIEAQVAVVENMLSQRHRFVVGSADWAALASRLGTDTPVREQFSGQVATLFRQAVSDARSALIEQGPNRRTRLTTARGKLVELIRRGLRPSCLKGSSEGLFNAVEFDPFFYLGLIDAHLALESRP
jgi:hypothetical protein